MQHPVTVIPADVLVVGGGFAGIWAALRAQALGAKVVLVEKGKVGYSGCSTLASGVQACVEEGDDLDLWQREMAERSEYFCDQDWTRKFLELQPQLIQRYLDWGAPIERDERGRIKRLAARGDVNTSVFMFRGRKLMQTLADRLAATDIQVLNRIMVAELLTREEGKRVTGALGLGVRTGEVYLFQARAVVLATGGIRTLKANRIGTMTGDGQAMAWRAGAELSGMEFCASGNINCWARQGYAGGINMFQGYGGKIVNALGERFMPRYDPLLQERALQYMLAFSYTKEALAGRGPIYFDMRHLQPGVFDLFRQVAPHPMKLFARLGINPERELIENVPAIEVPGTVAGDGGIQVDLHGESKLAGLFAAGAVTRNPIRGLESIGGLATASCNVMGYVAGEQAALRAREVNLGQEDREQGEELAAQLLAPLQRQGERADALRQRLLETTVPARYSLVKHERRIRQVLVRLEELSQEASGLGAPDPHELVKVHELRNLLTLGELVFRGALERQESRGFHYREEYPYTDNQNWVKLLVFCREGHRIRLTQRPILQEHWRYRPEPDKVSFPVQLFITEDQEQ